MHSSRYEQRLENDTKSKGLEVLRVLRVSTKQQIFDVVFVIVPSITTSVLHTSESDMYIENEVSGNSIKLTRRGNVHAQ